MEVDTTDMSWEMFTEVVETARQKGLKGETADRKKIYSIKEVESLKIVFNPENCRDIEEGKEGYQLFMRHFSETTKKFPIKNYTGNEHKLNFIVHFHPLLKWSADKKFVLHV